jgi:polar amino acid transport system substrate-binding protein
VKDISRKSVVAGLVAAACVCAALAGCGQPKQAELQPKISPPAVKEAGVLRAGVDLSYPPFAGTDNGQQAGLDVDVASALAQRLGLKLSLVDVKPSDAATALAAGRVDVVFSVPFSDVALSSLSLAGSYVSDGIGLFVATDSTASIEPTLTESTLPPPPAKVGAQKRSVAYWRLTQNLGTDAVEAYPQLRDAITALDSGDIPVVAGDALVGAYIARDFPNVHLAGQVGDASLLGVGVAPDNTALGDATRSALDALSADGVLDAIRHKWVGELPKLKAAVSDNASDTSVAPAP